MPLVLELVSWHCSLLPVLHNQPMVEALVSEQFQQPVVVVVDVGIIAQD